ncbi:MAG: hypothetical protein JPMHGGIA_02835 [Saprospiraceae bacterium]|nr:hypothetical protein [Saprospiraceae bacterium]
MYVQLKLLILIIIVLLSACQKETSESPLEGLIPVGDTTTLVSTPIDTIDLTGNPVLEPRVSGTWNIDLTGFRYVNQWNTMLEWKKATKYNTSGYCNYPKYIGVLQILTGGTNMCGPASFLMALSLVVHDWKIAVPSTDLGKAKRLSEFMKRYQLFHSGYVLGAVTYIAYLRDMANGTSSKKGEFTDWGNCDQKQSNAAELNAQPKTSSGRTAMKTFIRTNMQKNYPVIAIITIDPSKKDAYDPGYIRTTSGWTGHMVTVVGVTEDDINGIYQVRFKDPYAKNSKTYVCDYNIFLNSMIASTSYYNALAIKGQ